jgi:hypothetical protein
MPIISKPRTRSALPFNDPCAMLAVAQQAMYLLAAGQQVTVIETPALGRTEFSQGSIGNLQRIIDGLQRQCAEANGITNYPRRRVISIEACP